MKKMMMNFENFKFYGQRLIGYKYYIWHDGDKLGEEARQVLFSYNTKTFREGFLYAEWEREQCRQLNKGICRRNKSFAQTKFDEGAMREFVKHFAKGYVNGGLSHNEPVETSAGGDI